MKRKTTLYVDSKPFKKFKSKSALIDESASSVFRKFVKKFNADPSKVMELLNNL